MAAILETPTSSLPLSPEQRAIGALYAQEASSGTPQLALLVDIDGELDMSCLESAVQSVMRAHDALRTAVRQVPGFRSPRQQVLDAPVAPHWQRIDLRGRADAATALVEWIDACRHEPPGVADGAPLRVGIARLAETRHKLVLVASALVVDKGSLHAILDQVATACLTGQIVDADETFQYTQFVEWRQDIEGSEDAHVGRAYWHEGFERGDALPAPRLNTRMDGAPQSGGQPRIQLAVPLDAALAERVHAFAAQVSCGTGRLLQAAWWLLVARQNGQRPFVAGWQNDCRHDYEMMRGSVGVFEKVLPVAVEVAAAESFRDWAARLNATLDRHAEAQEFWAVDAPSVSAHLGVGFVFDTLPVRPRAASAWRVGAAPGPLPCFELALQAEQAGPAFTLSLHADASRYSLQALERLQWQFAVLLDDALARPEAPVGDLVLVGTHEREALLIASRGAAVDVGELTLAEQVAGWARTTPDAPALEAGDVRLSYREFDARIDRMARALQVRGAAAGTLVALNLPRSADLLVAMLASWRIGAGYLPLDPEWPAARRRAVLDDAAPSLVLHASGFAPDGDAPWPQATLDELECDDAAGVGAPARRPSMQDLAYVLYTSGSTGTPKGVVIEQGHLLNYVVASSSAMALDRCRRWALTSSVVADLGNTALFGAFHHGACLVVAGPGDVKDANAFSRFMRERRIDALKMVPSHLEALLEDEEPALPATLVLGGEAAPRALIERIGRLAPATTIYNHYGPTETTVGVMVHRVSAQDPVSAVLPLSRVLANNRVLVLDESLCLVPGGALGAVYVGGAQVCRGYLNRETGSAFVADPFEPGQLLYRTGDVACVLPEGGLRLVGRADDQVKIRGFRVEPAEVESVLMSQAGVRQAVVLALLDSNGGAELRAFVVADETLAPQAARDALRARLVSLLPAHMVPARCEFVAEFARLPNGKIDRQPLLSAARSDARWPAAATPRDALEAVLAECMANLLQRDAIGVEEDFFELGGHSLLVIKLVARLRRLLRLEVAPGLVFDHSSVAALAAAIRALDGQDLERMEQLAKTHVLGHPANAERG